MDRRSFIARGLALAAGAVGQGLVDLPSASAAPVLYRDSFARSATAKGWGGKWLTQRYGMPWGIKERRGYFRMPNTQFGATPFAPNPVLVLNRDVADVDITCKMTAANRSPRFGLVARATSYGDCYAAYVEAGRLKIARFTDRTAHVLASSPLPPGTKSYWIRFRVAKGDNVSLHAKAWKPGKSQPSSWDVTRTHSDPALRISGPGAFGMVFMHPLDEGFNALVEVSSFKAVSNETPRPTRPAVTFAYAGRMVTDQGATRARAVVKTAIPAAVELHWSEDASFGSFNASQASDAQGKVCIRKGWLGALPAGKVVYWRAQATTAAGAKALSEVHSLRTPPAPGQAVSFSFGSCTGYPLPAKSFGHAADLGSDLFVHLGDFGYAAGGGAEAASARTPAGFQDRWTRMLSGSTTAKLTKSAAWIMLQDDQDYGKGSAWRETIPKFSVGAWDEVSGNLNERFFAMRYGDAHFFFVDAHKWADNPDAPDGPGHSLLGKEQKSWLKNAMSQSDADLLVLFNPMPLRFYANAYGQEYKEIANFLSGLQTPNRKVLVCSGNSHIQHISHHSSPNAGEALYQFVSSGTDRKEQKSAPGNEAGKSLITEINAFGHVTLEAASSNRRVRLRSIASDSGNTIINAEMDFS